MIVVTWILAPPFLVALLGLLLVRTLLLPRVGCWLFYLATLALLVFALAVSISLLVGGFLLQHLRKEELFAGSVLVASLLLSVGRGILKLTQRNPFATIMRWFIQLSFPNRVGKIRPLGIPTQHPQVLAFSAVFEDSYVDNRFGKVEGWGVRACCKRLSAIKRR
jgi:hypothetical protein